MKVKDFLMRGALRAIAGSLILMGFLTCVVTAEASADTGRHPEANQVVVGAYIENIQGLDLQTNSFMADLYVWMRWMDPALKPYSSIEIMNPYESWAMTATPLTEEPVAQPDGSLYFAYRYQGPFSSKFQLSKFPFGEQLLRIQLEDQALEAGQVQYVLDTDPISLDPELTMPGYDIGEPTIDVRNVLYATTFGDYNSTTDDVYSRITITIPVTHPFWATALKVLLPILLVVVTASLIFQIPPGLIEARIGLGITALLTLVAMQWSALSELPDGGYLVMLDVLYILSFVFVLTTLIQSLMTSWRARSGDEAGAIVIDERSMIIDLAIFLSLTGAVLWIYLR